MESRKSGGNGMSVLSLVAALGLAGYVYVYSGLGAKIAVECQVNGLGMGQCTFTNTGWTAAAYCPWVGLTNTSNGEVMETQVCSGTVWPNDSTQKSYHVDRTGNHCKNLFGGMANNCEVTINEQPSTGQGPGSSTVASAAPAPSRQDRRQAPVDPPAAPPPEPPQHGLGYGQALPANFFKPLVPTGKSSEMSCGQGYCNHMRWISITETAMNDSSVTLRGEMLYGTSTHVHMSESGENIYEDYPDSGPAADEDADWDDKPSTLIIVCSKQHPSFDGTPLSLAPGEVYGATETIIRRYMEACHSNFGNPDDAIAQYGYNVMAP